MNYVHVDYMYIGDLYTCTCMSFWLNIIAIGEGGGRGRDMHVPLGQFQ